MATTSTAVYELWNHHGDLIYIGETYSDRVERRWNEHINKQPWGDEISLISSRIYGIYPDKKEARKVEKYLIQLHRPPYNKVHNQSWRAPVNHRRGRSTSTVGVRMCRKLITILLAVLHFLFAALCWCLKPGRGRRGSLPYKVGKKVRVKLRRIRRRRR